MIKKKSKTDWDDPACPEKEKETAKKKAPTKKAPTKKAPTKKAPTKKAPTKKEPKLKYKYRIELHIKQTDKFGERSYLRVLFPNGNIFVRSEKYTNVSHSKKIAKDLAKALNGSVLFYVEKNIAKLQNV